MHSAADITPDRSPEPPVIIRIGERSAQLNVAVLPSIKQTSAENARNFVL